METLSNITSLKAHLLDSFQTKNPHGFKSKLVGIVFARPSNAVRSYIGDDMTYFHFRSGKIMDYFWVGYVNNSEPSVFKVAGNTWGFDPDIYNKFRKSFTSFAKKWKYSGGEQLLLFNAEYHDDIQKVWLNLDDAIVINLRKAVKSKLYDGYDEIFEEILSVVERIPSQNPVRELSVEMGKEIGKSSFVNILFNLLPKPIKKDVQRLYLYGMESIK